MIHKPVLAQEVLEYLALTPNDNVVDGTVGQGGHTLLMLEKIAPNGKVLGIDQDASQIENAKNILKNFKDRSILVNGSYAHIKEILETNPLPSVNGILVDLGYSSWHIESSKKGFSFQKDEPLDMRYQSEITNYNKQITNVTAATIVNEYSQSEIEKILEEYGEEKFAKKIAKQIVKNRQIKKIESTFQLCQVIEEAVGRNAGGKIHYATRTFQALRIAVNNELASLQEALPQMISVLSLGGRLVVISFHSLEDRIVKHFFKEQEDAGLIKIVTPKPVMATNQELLANPRSRSAKLRAVVKS